MAKKTLIATLPPDRAGRLSLGSMTTVTIDGTAPSDIARLSLVIDANDSRPIAVELRRFRVEDGKPFYVSEIHDITNMALTIEYEEN